MDKFNNLLAKKLGNGLSSMPFFYVCVLLDAVELPPVIAAHSVIIWCTYLSQSVIQLIALPILGAQNKLQHENHKALMTLVKDNHDEHLTHIKSLHEKLDRIAK
jgi:hypothetical protein